MSEQPGTDCVGERLTAGDDWQDTGLVFTTCHGAALDAGNVRKMFKRVCAVPVDVLEASMPARTIRLLHRIAVDWTADTFGLRGRGTAWSRHDDARDRAHALARHLPDALHQPRQPRVLRSWQATIGRLAAKDQVRR